MSSIATPSELINENKKCAQACRSQPEGGGISMGRKIGDAPRLGTGSQHTARASLGDAGANPRPATRHYSVEVFTHEGLNIRLRVVVFADGSPWFLRQDVLSALDVSATVLRHLDYEEICELSVFDPATKALRLVYLLSASAILALVGAFTLCGRDSDKPDPMPLRKWLAREVLPTLHRKYAALEMEVAA